jgi:predicted phosphodiesterase
MKIAVLSDIHGNVPALDAVLADVERWRADELIVNGDLVSRGPHSLECLRMLRVRFPRVRLLTGNHETFVLRCLDEPPDPQEPTYDLTRFAQWTARQLGDVVQEIRAWGDHLDLTGLEGGSSVHVTHASRLGNRDGIYPETDAAALAAKLGDARDLFVTSHTHQAFVRRFNGTQIVNTGSVGQPLDEDPRAAYGRFSFRGGVWETQIVRLDYDKARAERDFVDSGFLDDCGPIVRLIYRELRDSRRHVAPWRARYLEAVQAAEITVARSVEDYLGSLQEPPRLKSAGETRDNSYISKR